MIDNKVQIADAINSLAPTSKYCVYENDINRIDWQNKSIIQPSNADIESEIIRLQEKYDVLQYQRDRTYPSTGDQLDMQYHDQLDGTTTWTDAIAKVKSDNPKPDGWKE